MFDLLCVFLLVLKKNLKMKGQVANEYLFVFFNIKENGLMIKIKLIEHLIKKNNTKGSLDLGSRFIVKIIFL